MEQIQRTQNTKFGIFLLIAGLALFCVGETIVKILANDYEITQIVWARYVFHGLVTVLIFLRFGFVKLTKPTRPWLHMLRSALMLIATTLYFSALRFLPLADAVAIHFIAPILITAFSIPILKEKVGPRRWAAIFVGFVGTIIIIRPGTVGMHWAALLPLGTAICYAVYQILTRIASRTDSTQTNLFWTSAFGIGYFFLCTIFLDPAKCHRLEHDDSIGRHLWFRSLLIDTWVRNCPCFTPCALHLHPNYLGHNFRVCNF